MKADFLGVFVPALLIAFFGFAAGIAAYEESYLVLPLFIGGAVYYAGMVSNMAQHARQKWYDKSTEVLRLKRTLQMYKDLSVVKHEKS